jgi:hypothetical protein
MYESGCESQNVRKQIQHLKYKNCQMVQKVWRMQEEKTARVVGVVARIPCSI